MITDIDIMEIMRQDSTFTESTFLAKVDNTYIMLLSAVMTDNLDKVNHKIGDELFNEYQEMLNDLNSKNQRQMYGELNVKSSRIICASIDEEKYYITAQLISRYLDYIVDKTTKDVLTGDLNNRVEEVNTLYFEKKKSAKNSETNKKCPGCGATIDFNQNGECPYCGVIFDAENYDWILTKIESEINS